jgi:hypothetical protein
MAALVGGAEGCAGAAAEVEGGSGFLLTAEVMGLTAAAALLTGAGVGAG